MSNGRFHGRTVIVTGGASGIGRATVRRFLDEGANVVAGDLNEANGLAMLEAWHADADRLRFLAGNVALENDIVALVSLATSTFGTLDVMFNNAGIGGAFGPITEVDVDAWDRTFEVLVRGVFLGTKHAARVMIPQGGGVIINTASVAGLAGGSGHTGYRRRTGAAPHPCECCLPRGDLHAPRGGKGRGGPRPNSQRPAAVARPRHVRGHRRRRRLPRV